MSRIIDYPWNPKSVDCLLLDLIVTVARSDHNQLLSLFVTLWSLSHRIKLLVPRGTVPPCSRHSVSLWNALVVSHSRSCIPGRHYQHVQVQSTARIEQVLPRVYETLFASLVPTTGASSLDVGEQLHRSNLQVPMACCREFLEQTKMKRFTLDKAPYPQLQPDDSLQPISMTWIYGPIRYWQNL